MQEAKEVHTTITGEVLEYPTPPVETAQFLARLFEVTNDPAVTESQMIALMFGSENPVLDQTKFLHRGVVTAETLESPVYQVMLDLLIHKRVQFGTFDVEGQEARFTMTTSQAAAELSLNEADVRLAIEAQKLSAIKLGDSYRLDPDSVSKYGK